MTIFTGEERKPEASSGAEWPFFDLAPRQPTTKGPPWGGPFALGCSRTPGPMPRRPVSLLKLGLDTLLDASIGWQRDTPDRHRRRRYCPIRMFNLDRAASNELGFDTPGTDHHYITYDAYSRDD